MRKLLFLLLVVFALIPVFTTAEGIIGTTCGKGTILDARIHQECTQQTNYNSWSSLLADSCQFVMDTVKESSEGYANLETPKSEMESLKDKVIIVGTGLILLAIVYAGLTYIVSSTDPGKRNKSKNMLIATLYMMIFMGAAYYLSSLAFDISLKSATMVKSNIDDFIKEDPWQELIDQYSGGEETVDSAYNKFSSLVTVAPIFLLAGWSYILLMYLRNMIVVLLTVISPLIMILFFFQPTKAFGITLFSLYGIELFIPVFMFPVFKIAELLFIDGSHSLNLTIMSAALAVGVVLHAVLVGVAIMKSSSFKGED